MGADVLRSYELKVVKVVLSSARRFELLNWVRASLKVMLPAIELFGEHCSVFF